MRLVSCGFLHCATRVALFFGLLFVMCIVWFFLQPVERDLHEALFRISFIGWTGLNASSFVFGLVQSLLWGYLITALWWIVGCHAPCRDSQGCCQTAPAPVSKMKKK